MSTRVTKVVVPVAGLGTRFLPATKALPKEMLPIVDKPVIQYVVEEAVDAGMTDVLMITGRHKNTIENHFDRAWEIESTLLAKGDHSRLDSVTHSSELAQIHYLRQGDALGLGHAVAKARHHVGPETFALMLGDVIVDPRAELLARMVAVVDKHGGSVVALAEVDADAVSSYGIASVEPAVDGDHVRIRHLVEKPSLNEAPSRLAAIGRYILVPEIFNQLDHTSPGANHEIQLTDALNVLAENDSIGGPVWGVLVDRQDWHDSGNIASYLQTVVSLAVRRDDVGREFRHWLREFVGLMD